MLTTTQQAFKFFREHAGYVVGKRAMGAINLARAEAALRADATVHVLWEDEDDADVSWMDVDELQALRDGRTFMLSVRLVRACPTHGTDCRHAETLASLGGVHVGPRGSGEPHCRVVEAELALDAGLADGGAQ